MRHRIAKTLLVVLLSGPLSVSGWLSLYHFLQSTDSRADSPEFFCPVAEDGSASWLVASHARELAGLDFCGVCIFGKSLKGAAPSSGRLVLPDFSAAGTPARPKGLSPFSPGLFRLSRSPPASVEL